MGGGVEGKALTFTSSSLLFVYDAATALDFNFDRSKGDIYTSWFKGSTTNLAHNCLDRQISAGRGDQVAIYAERNEADESAPQPDSYTYSELAAEVNRVANALKSVGVVKGDRVTIFMAMVGRHQP